MYICSMFNVQCPPTRCATEVGAACGKSRLKHSSCEVSKQILEEKPVFYRFHLVLPAFPSAMLREPLEFILPS